MMLPLTGDACKNRSSSTINNPKTKSIFVGWNFSNLFLCEREESRKVVNSAKNNYLTILYLCSDINFAYAAFLQSHS